MDDKDIEGIFATMAALALSLVKLQQKMALKKKKNTKQRKASNILYFSDKNQQISRKGANL